MLRQLDAPHTRIWLGALEEGPSSLTGSVVQEQGAVRLRFAAARHARGHGLAVRRMCQTASGGSFFALLGGTFTPDGTDQLDIHVPWGVDGAGHLERWRVEAVREGLDGIVDPPRGRLVLSHSRMHPVDDKTCEWTRVGAIIATLCGRDELGDDALLARIEQARASVTR